MPNWSGGMALTGPPAPRPCPGGNGPVRTCAAMSADIHGHAHMATNSSALFIHVSPAVEAGINGRLNPFNRSRQTVAPPHHVHVLEAGLLGFGKRDPDRREARSRQPEPDERQRLVLKHGIRDETNERYRFANRRLGF